MNAPFARRALVPFALLLAFAAPRFAVAQDAPPAPAHKHRCPTCGAEIPASRCPTCGSPVPDPVDRRLDEVLRREYGDPNGPALPPREEAAPVRPVPAPVPVRGRPHDENPGDFWEDTLQLKLGMSIDGGFAWLLASRIQGRSSTPDWAQPAYFGGPTTTDSGHHHHDGGGSFSLHGSTWLDIGRYMTVECASSAYLGRDQRRRDDNAGTPQPLYDPLANNGGTTGSGSHHKDRDVEYGNIDVDFVVHPLNGRFGRLDLIIGGRYLEARAGQRRHQHTVEAGMPMVGIGGVLRPVRTENGGFALELFARGMVGGFDYGDYGHRHGDYGYYDGYRRSSSYYAVSATCEGGVRFVFMDMFGVGVGARFEYVDVDKRDYDAGTDKKIQWKSVGPFIALSIEM